MSEPSYRLDEMSRLTRVSVSAIRRYVQQGLLAHPTPRGRKTVYSHEQLLRLKAIKFLVRERRMLLHTVKRRLSAMSLAEIEALASPPVGPQPVAKAEPSAEVAAPSPAEKAAPEPAEEPMLPAVRWDHIELLPGLELRLRSDAAPLLRRLAREICAQYGMAPVEPAPGGEITQTALPESASSRAT